MENKNIGIVIIGLMSGVLLTILGIINFVNPDPTDSKELLFGVIYLISGLSITGSSIYRLLVKK